MVELPPSLPEALGLIPTRGGKKHILNLDYRACFVYINGMEFTAEKVTSQ